LHGQMLTHRNHQLQDVTQYSEINILKLDIEAFEVFSKLSV